MHSTNEIIADLRKGKMVIIMDDEDRENEGDLLIAAEKITAEDVNFMTLYGRGLICLTLTNKRCEQVGLSLMVNYNGCNHSTNFTTSITATHGVTKGVSAADRARTIHAAVAENAVPEDLIQPGHIFPLMAKEGGVLSRAGHTEAGCDLARLAGLEPAAVIVEILNEDGTMARRPQLEKFSKEHDIKIGSIADLIEYRIKNEQSIDRKATGKISTEFGQFDVVLYEDSIEHGQHIALIYGEIDKDIPCVVRIHTQNIIRDLTEVGNVNHDWKIDAALKYISKEGSGVVVILHNQMTSYELVEQVKGSALDSKPNKYGNLGRRKELRDISLGAQIFKDLDIVKIRVLGSPEKMQNLAEFEFNIIDYIKNTDSGVAYTRINKIEKLYNPSVL